LRTAIGQTQKVMARVGEVPFLSLLLQFLAGEGFKRVILLTGYQAEDVRGYYRKNPFGLEIVFSSEKEPLGTGGAVKNARMLVNSNPFFVLNGDSFCPLNFFRMLDFHSSQKALATIAVSRVNESGDYGTILFDEHRQIEAFREKAAPADAEIPGGGRFSYVNSGVYCFEKKVFELMKPERFSLEKDFFPEMIGQGMAAYQTREEFYDIGTPERYQKASSALNTIMDKKKKG